MFQIDHLLALLALAGATLAPPANGPDPTCWIVLRDGHRLEARRPLEIAPLRLRFRLPSGALGSLPLSEVNLAATAREESTPLRARTVLLSAGERPATSRVGAAGEAAKRRGERGRLIDVTGLRAAARPNPGTIEPGATRNF